MSTVEKGVGLFRQWANKCNDSSPAGDSRAGKQAADRVLLMMLPVCLGEQSE